MTNFSSLLLGELQRLQKYHIFSASIVVAFFWIGALHLLETGDINFFFTAVIFFDIVSMSIVLVGVTIFFEKQEGVLKSLFVAPISRSEFISAKTAGNLISNLITILLVYIYALIFTEISLNPAGLLGAIILIGIFHSLVGFLIIYRCQSFTELLIGMMKYFLVMMLPVVLEYLGVFTNGVFANEMISNLIYLVPTKAAAVVIEGVTGTAGSGELLFSVLYLIVGSLVLAYFVFTGFKNFAARESGV